MDYSIVKDYLSKYSLDSGEAYDFNGLLHLVLTGIENLRKNALEQDLIDYSCTITDEQAIFIKKLLSNKS